MGDVRKEYKPLTEKQKSDLSEMKNYGQAFLDFLDTLEPCREQSLAKTKIEEAVMWSSKGITT